MGRRRRTRIAFLTAAAVLAVAAGLVEYAPHVVALAQQPKHRAAPATADPTPPDDWNRKGTYLGAGQAYPSVVRLLASDSTPTCSGTVVHSPGGDIVITAAHCVFADGSYNTGLSVAPGTTGGSNPHGTWQVDRIWVDPHYTDNHDEDYDYAFLRVTRSDGARIEDAVGANTLVTNLPYHLTSVTTTGYPDDDNPGDAQLTCAMDVYRSPAQPNYREMHCDGYTTGVSGGPWVLLKPGARTGELVGIVGGFNGGGPSDDDPHTNAISYSPYFTAATKSLLAEAVAGQGGQAGH
ncbi:trypsin-like serine protease [Streptomyces sp. PTM05]|uniref:Trypsin-like serine protease n=1 Tax=Streptantibioticus parmotrematis TaxID=2873249 RepID=A0ABS7QYF6_9ACTN|nr:trypsin-like serine protease [Streptantibioticus parmotrematis]MBY8888252.1 trypsin-like serine protease [Streptantibioticus parmotrematis]